MKQDPSFRPRSLDGVVRRNKPPIRPSAPLPPKRPIARVPSPPTFIAPAAVKTKKQRFAWAKKILPKTKKQMAVYTAVFVLLIGGAVVAKLLLTSCKIIACKGGNTALALQDNVDPTKLKGEGDGRVNILMMGIGDPNHEAANLTDTMQIMSLDPISKAVTMVSIPRDLYLKIPGYGYDRINAAHVYGERDGVQGGGPELLEQTISQNMGIPIHYFARVDFSAFKQAVDAVGGVNITVDETINDYSYPDESTGGYSTFYIQAGSRFLDGTTALKYARSRYTTSDFDRSKRQQKIMVAVKNKALSLGTLTNPAKISSLISSAGDNVKTDLNIKELVKLAKIGKEITDNKITYAGLDNSGENYLAATQIGGASVLVPKAGDFSEVKKYLRSIMPDGYIKKENASVDVLNGTTRAGVATTASELLKSYGYNVRTVGDAPDTAMTKTVIYDYTKGTKPYTIKYLEKRFGVKVQSKTPPANQPHADIVIMIGSDYKSTE